MGIDQEGYGFPEHQRTIARLMEDVRILSPSGVERVAQGWDEHVGEHGLPAFHAAEKAALQAIEKADRGPAWDEVRRTLFGMTESGSALISWRAEHGDMGHKAENAAFAAALRPPADRMIGQEGPPTGPRPQAQAFPLLLPGQGP